MLPMRGRDAELQQLMGAWKDVLAGEVRYVCISGEPGAGKTLGRVVGNDIFYAGGRYCSRIGDGGVS